MYKNVMHVHVKPWLALGIASILLAGCADETALPDQSVRPIQPMAALNTTETSAMAAPPKQISDKYVTLTSLSINNQGNQVMVKPGRVVQAAIDYRYHCLDCSQDSHSQIIIGLAKRSAQACIYDGGPQGQGTAQFTLKVPAKPGKYDVRFRVLQAADCLEALKTGWTADNSPSKQTTMGTLVVSRKAEADGVSVAL